MPPRIRVMLVVMICLALGACAVSSPQAGQTPSPTSRPIPTDTPPADTFFFTTDDGVTLNGQVIGSGKTALVFSNGQTVSKFFWLPVAQRLASQGYRACSMTTADCRRPRARTTSRDATATCARQ